MRFLVWMTALALAADLGQAVELTKEQKLIVACYRLDINEVVVALREGANVNARFGKGDKKLFQDAWSLGWPVAANKWTPLMAVASASDYPDPPRRIQNTVADLNWAREQKAKIKPEEIEQRRKMAIAIVMVLLSHNAAIDTDDGYGATALYEAVYQKKLELAKALLRFNPKVNTKTGIYIDGTGDITPLHRAYWSAELTKLLLSKGADPKAKDTTGETPLDWARRSGDPAVTRLYPPP